jgi:hypothetical protein
MQKLYLDLKYTSEIPGAFKKSADELMADSGVNLGNFAFRHALKFMIQDFYAYRPVRYDEFAAVASANDLEDSIVSCANWLGLTDQNEASNLNRSIAIEKFNGRVVCFGLGIQASMGAELPKLGPNTLRLAQVLAERAPLLSVRDQLTQDTLESEGIHNTVVTGCPSNFINSDPELGKKIAKRAREFSHSMKEWGSVRSCISEASGGHSHSGKVIEKMLQLMGDTPAFYLLQSPLLLKFVLGERGEIPASYRSNSPYKDQFGRLTQVLKSTVLHFTNMDSWMDFARTCDVSFGMRIHGTMVPLQSGTPSALIAHDSRTIGLAEHMGIPWASPEDFLKMTKDSPAPLFELIADAMEGYDANRAQRAAVYHDYMVKNGIEPATAFMRLVN